MNLNENRRALQANDIPLEPMESEIRTIKSEIVSSNVKLESQTSNTVESEAICNWPFQLKSEMPDEDRSVESNESIFIKQELLHEELDIKNEDEASLGLEQATLYENVDEIREADPWIFFKEWQAQQRCGITPVENAEYNINKTTILQDLATVTNLENNKSETTSCRRLQQKESLTVYVKLHDVVKFGPDIPTHEHKKVNSLSLHKDHMNDLDECETNVLDDSLENISIKDIGKNAQNNNEALNIRNKTTKTQNENSAIPSTEITAEQRKVRNEKKVECSLRKGRVWDKKDRCLYCNSDVTNFSRHLLRNHKNEESVQNITKLQKGDRNRKHMVDLLRKQGNFTIVNEKNIVRPVQRPASTAVNETLSTDYLPCKYCKGMYKIRSLRRHAKSCFFNSEKKTGLMYASEGQTILAFAESRQQFLDSLRVNSEVFCSMQADRISFNGKNDTLICQYAENYLRKHIKKPHIKRVVSNKVRELGRLLIPLQDIYGINNMLEALNPENYDKVVAATRIISGYNEATRSFDAPSLALHMRTSLLAVCAAAKSLLLRKEPCLSVTDYEQSLKNIKRFAKLVDSSWKISIGPLALKDLNVKSQTLPVTEDIIAFRNYTHKTAEMCMTKLKQNVIDLESFKNLTEAALALTIVLNRKRVADVEYTKLESYNSNLNNTNQEECLNGLAEKKVALSKHFKRIITVGKDSKSVPILFSKNLQEYMDVLLLVRKSTDFVPKENPFLFAVTGSSSKWVDGLTVLQKFAMDCGAKNPNILTSSRLRKQIATVLQILTLDQTEMEQVAAFMGHTKTTHEEFYKLPQDVFHTAKIAKLLLIMEKGASAENKGRTLNDIDLELEAWSNQNEGLKKSTLKPNLNIQEQCDEDNYFLDNDADSNECLEPTKDRKATKTKKPEKNSQRASWSVNQKSVMLSYFKQHLINRVPPKKAECLKLIEEEPDLFGDKRWVQIKVTRIFIQHSPFLTPTKYNVLLYIAEPDVICNQPFQPKLDKDVKHRRGVKCHICGNSCSNKSSLKTHLRSHTGEKPFKCNVCDCSFTVNSHLNRHIRTHTGNKPFKCNVCDYSCIENGNLQDHLRTHTGEKPFKCNICNSNFRQRKDLKNHFRTHTGEKPFKCDICESSFSLNSNLKRHLKIHTGEKPYKCNLCDYSCIENGNLQKHLKIHTGEKPFKCNLCDYCCIENVTLQKHLKTHTGEKPFKCNICNKTFSNKISSTKHIISHSKE